MNVDEYLKSRGTRACEGHCQQIPQNAQDLIRLSKGVGPDMLEIGFNAGHSADVLLGNNPDSTLVSFDLGYHDYMNISKEYIDSKYPGRHTLVVGNSLTTVPAYIAANPNKKFDFIFIDGGHEYYIADGDLKNCRNLAKPNNVVVMDDIVISPITFKYWNEGPRRTWNEHIERGQLTEYGHIDYTSEEGRGMSWGKYIIDNADSSISLSYGFKNGRITTT
jgi:predicted O-methyltransferase YrrM